ncbi:MAG TPA: hypothetical protein VGN72_20285 [Tepidisphaeraceae bacterium]|jgi:prepilin-type processing-associated H-X9-DG protein|nr:hypothetical protein [Tepidisphaeraceae bacterium]
MNDRFSALYRWQSAIGAYGFDWDKRPTRITRVRSGTVLTFDGSVISNNPGADPFYFSTHGNPNWNPPLGQWGNFAPWPVDRANGKGSRRHNGTFSVGFVDGHVEQQKKIDANEF